MAAVVMLAACASPTREPTPTASASPTPVPTASPSPRPSPEIVCDPPPATPSTLTCDRAVEVALAALPATHLPIWRIEFHFGRCPPTWRCAYSPPNNDGFVIFHVQDPGPDLWVNVTADSSGVVSLTSDVAPFPPSG